MRNARPIAYFLTFSTYGTWLHGTEKEAGSVDKNHNAYGGPRLPPDSGRVHASLRRMTDPPYLLSLSAREIVRNAIIGLCQEKGWWLIALHVRTNHVHLVVAADRNPARLLSDIKSRASRELNRSGDRRAKRWTRHGSTRHLFDDSSVADAVAYTLDEQGELMATFDRREQTEPRTQ